jgi:hypothetical protein
MKLEVVELVVGTETPAGDGNSGALRCTVRLPDKTMRAAVLKRGPLDEIAAEAFAALLLRAWSLPVPEPFLVVDGSTLSFASADMAYPNLKQCLGLLALPEGPARDAAVSIAASIAASLPTAPLAAACDEAIDNRDRNLGNILWDGSSEAWIDHALSLGRAHAHPDINKLCQIAASGPNHDQFSRAAVAQSLILDRTVPPEAEATLATRPMGAGGYAAFVAARLTSLGNRLVARFPAAADLLSKQ